MKLNLGSGGKKGLDGWLNIDILEGADLCIDLRDGIPIQSSQVEMIYTSHFLEHLEPREILALLGECHRVLKPGGKLSICVPDASLFIRSYADDDYRLVDAAAISNNIAAGNVRIPSFLFKDGQNIYSRAVISTGSKIDWINYIAYSAGEHKYMFDAENLVSHLRLAGFEDARLREYDPLFDSEMHQGDSIFAIGSRSVI